MYRIHPAYLLWVLESIMYDDKKPVNIIEVDEETKSDSNDAMDTDNNDPND